MKDKEANAFACALLMPDFLFVPALQKLRDRKMGDDEILIELSKQFMVPLHSVAFRITMLESMPP